MTPQQLTDYFETATLPETLRLDRASTQHNVKEAVKRNLETMTLNNDGGRAKHRLIQIMNAQGTPYDGPGARNYNYGFSFLKLSFCCFESISFCIGSNFRSVAEG